MLLVFKWIFIIKSKQKSFKKIDLVVVLFEKKNFLPEFIINKRSINDLFV